MTTEAQSRIKQVEGLQTALDSKASAWNEAQTYYVGKHGSDTNDGKGINEAFLTLGAAITAVTAQTPGPANRFVIIVLDAGIYPESVSFIGLSYTRIYAPNATLVGKLTLNDFTAAVFKSVEPPVNVTAVERGGTAGWSYLEAERIIVSSNDGTLVSGIDHAQGDLYVDIGYIEATAPTSLWARCVYVHNNGRRMFGKIKHLSCQNWWAFRVESLARASVEIDLIELGGADAVGISVNGADYRACFRVGEIAGIAGTGIQVSAAGDQLNCVVGKLQAGTAYDVTDGILHMLVGYLDGAETTSGSAYVAVTESGLIGRAPDDIHQLPYLGVGSFDPTAYVLIEDPFAGPANYSKFGTTVWDLVQSVEPSLHNYTHYGSGSDPLFLEDLAASGNPGDIYVAKSGSPNYVSAIRRYFISPNDDLAAIVNGASGGEEFILTEGTHVVTTPIVVPAGNITIRGSRQSIIDADLTVGPNDLFTVTDKSDVVLEGFTVQALLQADRAVVRFDTTSVDTYRNKVRGIRCDIETNRARFVHHVATAGGKVRDWEVAGNDVTGQILDGVRLQGSGSAQTYENTLKVHRNSFVSSYDPAGVGPHSYGVYWDGANSQNANGSIAYNYFKTLSTGVYLNGPKGTVIDHNIIEDTLDEGGHDIQTANARHVVIQNNQTYDCRGAGSINAGAGRDQKCDYNLVYKPVGYGILAAGDHGSTCSGNTVRQPGLVGVDVVGNDQVAVGSHVYDAPKDYAVDSFTAPDQITFDAALGNITSYFPVGRTFTISGSGAGNNGTFTVESAAFGTNTVITTVETTLVTEGPTNAIAQGVSGIRVSGDRVAMTGCSVFGGRNGFEFNATTQSDFSDCVARGSSTYGFHLIGASSENTVADCIAYAISDGGTGGDGFYVDGNRYSLVGCKAIDCTGYGFRSSTGDNTNYSGCYAENNGNSGFYLNNDSYTKITGCYANGNTNHGIELASTSDHCQITDNFLLNNGGYGIREVNTCSYDMFANNYYEGNTLREHFLQGTNPAIVRHVYPHEDLAALVNTAAAGQAFYLAEGRHVVTTPIVVPADNISITGSRQAIIDADLTGQAADLFTMTEREHLTFEGFKIEANLDAGRAVFNAVPGTIAFSTQHITVRGVWCNIDATYADFFVLESTSASYDRVYGFDVSDNLVTGNVRRGIRIRTTSDNFINKTRVVGNFLETSYASAEHAIYVESGNNEESLSTIARNIIPGDSAAHTTRENWQYGIWLEGLQHSSIHGNAVEGTTVWGYQITAVGASVVSNNAGDCSGSGAFNISSANGTVTGNTAKDITKVASEICFDLSGGGLVATGNSADGGDLGFDVGTDTTVSACTSSNAGSFGFRESSGTSRATLRDCVARDSAGTGFWLDGPDNDVIGCYAYSNGSAGAGADGAYGFWLRSSRVRLTACIAERNYDHGFYAGGGDDSPEFRTCTSISNGSQNNEGLGVAVEGTTDAKGFYVEGDHPVIVGCTAKYNAGDGIWHNNSTEAQITNNYLVENGGYGLVEASGASKASYGHNTSHDNQPAETQYPTAGTDTNVETTTQSLGNFAGTYNDKVAQSFKVGVTREYTSVAVEVKRTSANPGTVTLRVETDLPGEPSGTLVDAAATGTLSVNSGFKSMLRVVFSTPVTLTAGTTYWIVLSLPADPTAGRYVTTYKHSGSSYADGKYQYHPNGGSWTDGTEITDMAFRVSYINDEELYGGSDHRGHFYDPGALTEAVFTGFSDVINQVGQENHILVYNNTGAQINNGTPVALAQAMNVTFPDGKSRAVPTIIAARADTFVLAVRCIGLTTHDIPNGQLGMVTNQGIIRGLNTAALSTSGALYLANTGGFTQTAPAHPSRVIILGGVIKVDATEGEVYVLLDTATLQRQYTPKDYFFTSNGLAAGTYYAAGFYRAPLASVTRTQASTSHTWGTANNPYAAHPFLVAGGAGTASGGTGPVQIVVTGTRIQDDGTRTPGYTAVLVADITTLALNQYVETPEKFLGQVTYLIRNDPDGQGPGVPSTQTTFSATFNYGWAKYEDLENRNYYVSGIECIGLAGANDSAFNVQLLHHKSTGWTYSAAAFVPGNGEIVGWSTDMSTEDDLANGQPFAWKHVDINQYINGAGDEGVIFKIVCGQNNSVQKMDLHLAAWIEPS